MTFLRLPVVLLGASLLAACLLAASAAAHDPCTGRLDAVDNRFVVVGVFTGDCAGAYAGERLVDCHQVIWGVYTTVAGVGGHNGCSAMAYVSPEGADDPVDCGDLCRVLP